MGLQFTHLRGRAPMAPGARGRTHPPGAIMFSALWPWACKRWPGESRSNPPICFEFCDKGFKLIGGQSRVDLGFGSIGKSIGCRAIKVLQLVF
jgi:hypothetical protein